MRTALLLIALVPSVALAQLTPQAQERDEAPSEAVAPAPDPQAQQEDDVVDGGPPLHWAPPSAKARAWTARGTSTPLRTFVMFGGAVAGGAVGASAGYAAGCLLGVLTGNSYGCGTFGAYLAVFGGAVAIPTGMLLSSRAVGGNGSILATVAGYLLGGALIYPSVLLMNEVISGLRTSSNFTPGFAVLISLFPFVGALLGHELTQSDQVTPVLSLAPGRAYGGFEVRF